MTVHAYQAVKRVSTVEGSSPHELICILYDAALSQIAMAQQHIDHKNYQHLFLCADKACLLYTSPSPRDLSTSRMPSSA